MATSVAASRKHVELSLELKRKLIQEHEHGVPFTLLGKKYHIATSTAANIWRKKDFFLRSRMSGSRKRCNDRSKYKIVNQVTALFVKSMLERNHKIDGEVIKRYARTTAAHCNFKDFHGSNGWLDSFKKRENVCWVRRRGEQQRPPAAAAAAAAATTAASVAATASASSTTANMGANSSGGGGPSSTAAAAAVAASLNGRSESPNLCAAAAAAAVAATAQRGQHHRHSPQLIQQQASGGAWRDTDRGAAVESHGCARCDVAAAAAAVAALNSSDSIHERDHEIEDWFHGIPFLCQFFEEYQSMHQAAAAAEQRNNQQQLQQSAASAAGVTSSLAPQDSSNNNNNNNNQQQQGQIVAIPSGSSISNIPCSSSLSSSSSSSSASEASSTSSSPSSSSSCSNTSRAIKQPQPIQQQQQQQPMIGLTLCMAASSGCSAGPIVRMADSELMETTPFHQRGHLHSSSLADIQSVCTTGGHLQRAISTDVHLAASGGGGGRPPKSENSFDSSQALAYEETAPTNKATISYNQQQQQQQPEPSEFTNSGDQMMEVNFTDCDDHSHHHSHHQQQQQQQQQQQRVGQEESSQQQQQQQQLDLMMKNNSCCQLHCNQSAAGRVGGQQQNSEQHDGRCPIQAAIVSSDYNSDDQSEFYLPAARYVGHSDTHSDDLIYHDEVSDHNDCCSDHYDPAGSGTGGHELQLNEYQADLNPSTGACYMDEYEYENISTIRHYPLPITSQHNISSQQQHSSFSMAPNEPQSGSVMVVGNGDCTNENENNAAHQFRNSNSNDQQQQMQQIAQCQGQQQQQQQQNYAQAGGNGQQLAIGSATNNSSSSSLSSSDNIRSDFGQQQINQCQHNNATDNSHQQQQANYQQQQDSNQQLLNGVLGNDHEQAIEHADHEEHNLLHNALMRSPEKLKLIDSIITLLNYASNYNQKMLQPLLEIKRCIERDLEVVLSDTSNSVAAAASAAGSCCGSNNGRQRNLFDQQLTARRSIMAIGSIEAGLCVGSSEQANEANQSNMSSNNSAAAAAGAANVAMCVQANKSCDNLNLTGTSSSVEMNGTSEQQQQQQQQQ